MCALQGGFLLTLALPEDDRNFDDKADILDVNGFREEWQFALRAAAPPETGLLAFLRLMNCSGESCVALRRLQDCKFSSGQGFKVLKHRPTPGVMLTGHP